MAHVENYRRRLIEKKLELYMNTFGAVHLFGTKWCGKSTTGEMHAKSVVRILDPDNNFSTRTLATMSPDYVLNDEKPTLIDEWQEVPPIWDAVRAKVDELKQPGQFILTGSNIPLDSENHPKHSGAGRIGSIYMTSMTLYEMGDSSGVVSLEDIFDNPIKTPVKVWNPDINEILRFCVRGGWPITLDMPDIEREQLIAVEYLKKVIDEDINKRVAKNKRSTRKIESLFYAIAKNEYTVNPTKGCLEQLENKGEKLSRNTFMNYFNLMETIYLIREQPAFSPRIEYTTKRVPLTTGKFRFVDPSLVVAALKLTPSMLLRDMTTLSHIFDNLCVHDLEVYADYLGARVYHYRDSRGGYADSIIELEDGRWGAFMHRLGVDENDAAAAELLKLKKFYEAEGCAPSVLGIISGMEQAAYTREDGVLVIPITGLKP